MIPGKIPGVVIVMAGVEYQVPPLTLGQLRRLEPKLKVMAQITAAGMTSEQIDAIVEIVTTALSRNYPEVSAEQVIDLLDMGNARDVILAVLTGSGAKLGEAVAVAMSNGAISTASSPPPADTAIQRSTR